MSSTGKGPVPDAVLRQLDARDLKRDRLTGRHIGDGRNAHHRKLRSRGGENTAGNLVTLSGSGTVGTHGWVHANIAASERTGFIVPSWIKDPATVPILMADAYGRKSWHRLRDNGTADPLEQTLAERIMRDLGIWTEEALF